MGFTSPNCRELIDWKSRPYSFWEPVPTSSCDSCTYTSFLYIPMALTLVKYLPVSADLRARTHVHVSEREPCLLLDYHKSFNVAQPASAIHRFRTGSVCTQINEQRDTAGVISAQRRHNATTFVFTHQDKNVRCPRTAWFMLFYGIPDYCERSPLPLRLPVVFPDSTLDIVPIFILLLLLFLPWILKIILTLRYTFFLVYKIYQSIAYAYRYLI